MAHRTSTLFVKWTASVLLATTLLACQQSSDPGGEVERQQAALTTTPQLIVLPFPKGTTRDSVGLSANGSLKLDDRASTIEGDGSPSQIANAGGALTELGVQAKSGTITSLASVNLRNNARVTGDLLTSGVLTTQAGATVTGTISQNVNLTPFNEFSWTVALPQQNSGDFIVQPDGARPLSPGSYANVTVYSRAKLQVGTGVYFMNALDVEPQAQLILDMTNGPIVFYVRNSVIYRGQIVEAGGPEGNFLLVYLGSSGAFLEQPFTGTVVAPAASLTLGSSTVSYRGTFFAHDIEVRPDTVVVKVPFDWTRLFGPPPITGQLPTDPINPPQIPPGPFGTKLTPVSFPRAFPRVPIGKQVPFFGVGPTRGGTPAPRPEPQGATTPGFVDNIGWGYTHEAIDYVTPEGVLDEGEPGKLVDLSLKRFFKPAFAPIVSSFGRGMFSNYDTKLRVVNNGAGGFNIMTFHIDNDLGEVTWTELDNDSGDNQIDGVFHTTTGIGKTVTLLTSTGTATPNPFAAATAVFVDWAGNQTVFEIVNTGSDVRSGRLLRELDLNGNAVSVAYRFPANASLAQLGNDRTRLWQMASVTDPHGLQGTFDYQTTKVNNRWCVSAFHAPNGTTVTYTYNGAQVLAGIVGPALTRVTFPDGTFATFTTAVEGSTNLAIVHINDPAAQPGFMVKDVYLSQAQMRTAAGALVAQQPNLLRQIINGAGEVAYANWDDPAQSGRTFVYEGGGTLLRLDLNAGNVPVAFARANFFDPSRPPSQAVFDPVETYQNDDRGHMTTKTDAGGRQTAWEIDRQSLLVRTVQFPDGSRQARTFGLFSRLTSLVDRNGNVNQYTYDLVGNVIAAVRAVAQSIASQTSATVNSRGQTVRTTDARGNVTDYVYDGRGFLTSSTQPPDSPGGPRAVRRYEYDSAGRMTARVDPNGRREIYAYDARNRLVRTTFPDATTQIVTYGSGATASLIVSTVDRNRNITNVFYDASGRLARKVDGVGTSAAVADLVTYLPGTTHPLSQSKRGELTSLSYDSKGRVVSTTAHPRAAQALVTQTTYDALGRQTSSSDAYGRRTFFFFDSEDRLARTVRELVVGGITGDPGVLTRSLVNNPSYAIEDHFYSPTGDETIKIDPVGTITRNQYDGLRRLVQKEEASGTAAAAVWQYSYDVAGNLTELFAPRNASEEVNSTTAYTYNGRNLISSITKAPGSPEQAITQIAYTLTKKRASITNPRGGVTRLAYSACCDNLERITEPNGAVTTYVSDALGNRLSATDANGNRQSTTYDALSRPTSATNGAGEVKTFAYDDNLTDGAGIETQIDVSGLGFGSGSDGTAVLVTDATGAKRVRVLDGLGRPVLEKDETGNLTSYAYDIISSGGLLETRNTDPLGHTTRNLTDALGNPRLFFDAEGRSVVKGFDAAGRLVLSADPTNRGKVCTVDALGRTTNCTDTAGDHMQALYDSEGNTTGVVDGLGKTSQVAFDVLNRPIRTTNRLGFQNTTTYDTASNVTSTTDAEGGVTTYTYDARNLRTQERFPDGSTIQQEYDIAGRLMAQTQADGVRVVNTYDAADRLVRRDYPDGTSDSFVYDRASRIVRAVSGRYQNTVDRTYDVAGRLTSESLTIGGVTRTVSSSYDASGRRTSVTYPDGSVVTRSYTPRSLLATVNLGSQTLANYTYDDAGRVLSNTLGNGKIESYSYRGDGALATLAIPGVSSLSYQYNANKRVVQELRNTQAFDNFGYDDEQRLILASRAGVAETWVLSPEGDWQTVAFNGVVSESRSHNRVHEITAINETLLSYDARGQLTADDIGRLFTWGFTGELKRAVQTGESTTTVDYTYDAFGRRVSRTATGGPTTVFVNDGDEVIAEYDDGTLARRYVLGANVDQPIAMLANSSTYYFARQVNSSIHAVMSASGAVVERYEYDAYGFRTIRAPDGSALFTSAIGNAYGFTGRYHDADIGIIDFRSRQYDPGLGRFLSRDNRYVDGMSLYQAYFPPDGIDPTGHWGWSDLNPVNLVKDTANAVSDAGKAVIGAGTAAVNTVATGVGTAVNAVGSAATSAINTIGGVATATVNAVGNLATSVVNTVGGLAASGINALTSAATSVANFVGGAVVWAGTELLSGAEYLGTQIWQGAKFIGVEAWKGAVALARGGWRLAGEFVDDAWQSVKTLALATWDVLSTSFICAWDIVQFYGLLFTGHPLDALKKLTAGIGNLGISVFEAGLIFGSVLGGWANPIGGFTTFLGIALGLIGWALGGDAPEIHWHNGGFVFEFGNSPFAEGKFGDYSRTLGRAILYHGDPADSRAHEWQHVTQYGLLGETYIPAHLISQGISAIAAGSTSGTAYAKYNVLEMGPYMPNHQPWPNIPRIPW